MLRKTQPQTLAWPDKTMSVMQQRKLEECEKRIRALPSFGLWQGCTDSNAEILWGMSLEAEERPARRSLHTAASLQEQVMERLPAELSLLSMAEYEMVSRLIAGGGEMELQDWFEFAPAESLARRLWATLTLDGDDRCVLRMPMELASPISFLLASPEHLEIRGHMLQFFITVICALNIYGMVFAEDALTLLERTVSVDRLPCAPDMIRRMLHQTYDYVFNPAGSMVLLHPGLAEPERWLNSVRHVDLEPMLITDPEADVPQMMLSDGERGAALQMSGLLSGVLRPDLNLPMAVEDLRVLIKQGVALSAAEEVLASLITVRPTADILEGLRLLYSQTPGFVFVSTRQVH